MHMEIMPSRALRRVSNGEQKENTTKESAATRTIEALEIALAIPPNGLKGTTSWAPGKPGPGGLGPSLRLTAPRGIKSRFGFRFEPSNHPDAFSVAFPFKGACSLRFQFVRSNRQGTPDQPGFQPVKNISPISVA
jgi:hypothetical protein